MHELLALIRIIFKRLDFHRSQRKKSDLRRGQKGRTEDKEKQQEAENNHETGWVHNVSLIVSLIGDLLIAVEIDLYVPFWNQTESLHQGQLDPFGIALAIDLQIEIFILLQR